jgi:enhancing lycopene biosynthesis protein 2
MTKVRRLIPTRYANALVVEGRCSVCHRPFDSPLEKIAIDASNQVVRDFDAHICNEDVSQAAAGIVRKITVQ